MCINCVTGPMSYKLQEMWTWMLKTALPLLPPPPLAACPLHHLPLQTLERPVLPPLLMAMTMLKLTTALAIRGNYFFLTHLAVASGLTTECTTLVSLQLGHLFTLDDVHQTSKPCLSLWLTDILHLLGVN